MSEEPKARTRHATIRAVAWSARVVTIGAQAPVRAASPSWESNGTRYPAPRLGLPGLWEPGAIERLTRHDLENA